MPVNISALSYALRKQCQSAGADIQLSHCQQLLSAAIGYKSLAAHHAAQAAGLDADDLDNVDSVILVRHLLVSRANELKMALDAERLVSFISAAFDSCLPGVPVFTDEDSWSERIRKYIVDLVESDGNVGGLINDTNNDGIEETYVPFDLSTEIVPPPAQTLSTSMQVNITLGIDTERPYTGHRIDAAVELHITRLGRAIWGAPQGHVTNWRLRYDEHGYISRAQALANEFGLTLEEAEELEDVEAHEHTGHDDTVYGYYFDFSEYASPAVAAKLMAKFGRLDNLRVSLNFFDNIEPSFD